MAKDQGIDPTTTQGLSMIYGLISQIAPVLMRSKGLFGGQSGTYKRSYSNQVGEFNYKKGYYDLLNKNQ